MKSLKKIGIVVLAVVVGAVAAVAASLPKEKAFSGTAGSGSLSNDAAYAVMQLGKVKFVNAQPNGTNVWTATITRTWTRTVEGGTNTVKGTNTLGTVASAAGGATSATYSETNTAVYIYPGDLLGVSGVGTGTFSAVPEFLSITVP